MSATVHPLRQRSGDPACLELLHRARQALEGNRDLLLDQLAGMGLDHNRRVIVETAVLNTSQLIVALHAVAPPRTIIKEDTA